MSEGVRVDEDGEVGVGGCTVRDNAYFGAPKVFQKQHFQMGLSHTFPIGPPPNTTHCCCTCEARVT